MLRPISYHTPTAQPLGTQIPYRIPSIPCIMQLSKHKNTTKSNTQMKSIILIIATYFFASVQAFCFYNIGSQPIRVLDVSRLSISNGQACFVDGTADETFYAQIAPGAKSCWLWSQFSSSPCSSITYAVTPYAFNNFQNIAGNTDGCWSFSDEHLVTIKSGSGVTVGDGFVIQQYPNSQCL
jgi:hypothetical protein